MRYLGQVAKDWLTSYHDFQWYYQYKGNKIVNTVLYKRANVGQVVSMDIKVIDNREKYYEKLLNN